MKAVARFVTRGTGRRGEVDLVLGTAFRNNGVLKPNRIYELRLVADELMFVDVGPSAIGKTMKDSRISVAWCHTVNDILNHGGTHLLTREEMRQQVRSLKRRNSK